MVPTQVLGSEHGCKLRISDVLAFVIGPTPYFGYFSERCGDGKAKGWEIVHSLDKT
jgi:hypothetical protein